MDLLTQFRLGLEQANLWGEAQTLARNTHLTVQGSRDDQLYWVVSGCFRIYVLDEVEEHTIRFGYQDNLIMALDTFVTGQATDLYIQALKKSVVRAVPRAAFRQYVEADAERFRDWARLLELLVFQQMERERDLLTSSPVQRFERLLARSPQVFQEVPMKYIASYLRMTPETLSRIQKS